MNLKDTVAFITGSNRGLGRALVEDLLRRGAKKVYAAARDPETGITDPRVIPVVLDVTSPSQAETAAAQCTDVHLLINNAGSLTAHSVLHDDPEHLRRDLDVNFYGPLNMARAFVPVLGRGHSNNDPAAILNILSVAALANMPVIGGYSASKAAAWSLTQALRGELRGRGIRVLAAFPGPMDTAMARGFEIPKTSPQEVAHTILDGVTIGRENIAPDPMSMRVLDTFAHDPRELERQFSV